MKPHHLVTVGDVTSLTSTPPPGERALARMHRYTTISLCGVLAFFTVIATVQSRSILSAVATFAVGLIVTLYTMFWERRPALWLTIIALTASIGLWTMSLVGREPSITALFPALVIAMLLAYRPRPRWWWYVIGFGALALPVAVVSLVTHATDWRQFLLVAAVAYGLSVILFALNTYGWGLYLEIDAARRVGAELAVAQERFRFAADLHDIQGHTLHVINLKTKLARKLLEKDPAAAAAQLEEAEQLIAETLANTRSLAFGDRRVAVASELANARELFEAAGIRCTVRGEYAPAPDEELFGLLLREATTNILRHSQATAVTFTFAPGRLIVENDGSPATARSLSGLARLGERFAAAGGRLSTATSGGHFTTDAVMA